jgi:phosphohistidine phosphatase
MARAPHSVRVVLLRHGPAAIRDPVRWPDDSRRPLTAKGADQTREAVCGLARYLGRVTRLATSEAVRCRVTAEMLRTEVEPLPRLEVWDELSPGQLAPPILERLATASKRSQDVVLVGHEPTFAELMGLALVGEGTPFIHLGKGSAACIEFAARVRPGAGKLRWLLTRKQLARVQ